MHSVVTSPVSPDTGRSLDRREGSPLLSGRGAPTEPPRPVRLTRRGRLVVMSLILAVLVLALVGLGAGSAATGDSGPPATRTVVVAKGDTLWAIAADVAGPGEIREVVHRIQQINELPGPELVEGQRLAVPVG